MHFPAYKIHIHIYFCQPMHRYVEQTRTNVYEIFVSGACISPELESILDDAR